MASANISKGPQRHANYLPILEIPKLEKEQRTRRKMSWLSTKISRNSSLTSKSRSIPIFVHVGDLMKPPSSSLKLSPAQECHEDAPSTESDPTESGVGPSRTITTNPSSSIPEVNAPTAPFHPADDTADKEVVTPRGEGRSSRKTGSIYSLFPEPPDPLEHFDKWFPESPQESIIAEETKARTDKSLPQPPYHVFDKGKRMRLVILVSLAGILSPLSTSIYLPALTVIASEFQVSTTLVLLTIAVFMIFQGVAPFLWMPLCNKLGRRPVFIAALLVFVGANIGLVLSKSFAALMILRAVQSIGSAALTATCAGVIGDISTTKERGRFIGLFGAILMFTFISPVIGGILTHWMGFRSIFYFLLAFGGVVLILIISILPETLRTIAGNGTIRLRAVQQPLINVFKCSSDTPFHSDLAHFATQTNGLKMENAFEQLRCLRHKEVLATTLLGSVAFAICTTVITTTTTMFEEHYQLSIFVIGLAFIPAGAGSVLSFFLTGYLLDNDLRVVEKEYREMYDIENDVLLDHKVLLDFPIERARLRNSWWITLVFVGATAGYGFSFNGMTLAGPLILQFFIASSATSFLLINGVFIADLYSGHGSVTLPVNLCRFLMGALAVGTVQLALDRIANGMTFLLFAMTMLALTPIMVVQWMFGKPWRARRNSTWPRRKLSEAMGLPDFGRLGERIIEFLRGMRMPILRGTSSETADADKSIWPR